jgi:hypothetical protein
MMRVSWIISNTMTVVVAGGKEGGRIAAGNAAHPRRFVLRRVGNVLDVVVALVFGPLQHRHATVRRFDHHRLARLAHPVGVVGELRRRIDIRARRLRRARCRQRRFERCGVEVEPRALDVGLAIGRTPRLPLLRRLGGEAHRRCERDRGGKRNAIGRHARAPH